MRHQHQRRAALGLLGKQEVGDLPAGLGVEIAGRLVGDQQFRAIATRCCSPPESWPG
jgi:hypothetical protein